MSARTCGCRSARPGSRGRRAQAPAARQTVSVRLPVCCAVADYFAISTTTLRQAVTPGHALGRVSAIMVTATSGSRPIGAAIGALVGATLGAETCIVVAALGFLVQAGLILTSPVPHLARQPDMVG